MLTIEQFILLSIKKRNKNDVKISKNNNQFKCNSLSTKFKLVLYLARRKKKPIYLFLIIITESNNLKLISKTTENLFCPKRKQM